MEFTLIFPSNAQPDTYQNTASYFQTDLENPIDLNGRWEVALQDLSYVNTIKTLSNESLLLGYANHENVTSGSLESAENVVLYDLQTQASKWSSKIDDSLSRQRRGASQPSTGRFLGKFISRHSNMVRQREKERCEAFLKKMEDRKASQKKTSKLPFFSSVGEQRAYDNKVIALLNVLNDLAPLLWTWRYDVLHKIAMLYFKPASTQTYGFYVSRDLKGLLGLKSQLFLPASKFPYADSANAFLYQVDRFTTVSHPSSPCRIGTN